MKGITRFSGWAWAVVVVKASIYTTTRTSTRVTRTWKFSSFKKNIQNDRRAPHTSMSRIEFEIGPKKRIATSMNDLELSSSSYICGINGNGMVIQSTRYNKVAAPHHIIHSAKTFLCVWFSCGVKMKNEFYPKGVRNFTRGNRDS